MITMIERDQPIHVYQRDTKDSDSIHFKMQLLVTTHLVLVAKFPIALGSLRYGNSVFVFICINEL